MSLIASEATCCAVELASSSPVHYCCFSCSPKSGPCLAKIPIADNPGTRTGLTNPYPVRQAASIVALAAFNVAWVSRVILPFAIKLRSLAFSVVVE